jgi:hypothetical protein
MLMTALTLWKKSNKRQKNKVLHFHGVGSGRCTTLFSGTNTQFHVIATFFNITALYRERVNVISRTTKRTLWVNLFCYISADK